MGWEVLMENVMDIQVIRFDREHLDMLPHQEEAFAVIGRLIPVYDGVNWSVSEELYTQPQVKIYPDDVFDPMQYIDNPNEAAFLALDGQICVGSIRVCRRWNGMGFIDDLKVNRAYRRIGIGKRLMDAALGWCRECGFCGLSLETQDNNLIACRFYQKYGFALGGIDRKVYTNGLDETALYFYLSNDIYNA